jgi:hypothetical protein
MSFQYINYLSILNIHNFQAIMWNKGNMQIFIYFCCILKNLPVRYFTCSRFKKNTPIIPFLR